jgi:hypothetical protein
MPTYRLEPIDPTDTIWEGSPIKDTILIDAADEQEARNRVAVLALTGRRRSPPFGRSATFSLWLLPSVASCAVALSVSPADFRP